MCSFFVGLCVVEDVCTCVRSCVREFADLSAVKGLCVVTWVLVCSCLFALAFLFVCVFGRVFGCLVGCICRCVCVRVCLCLCMCSCV